MNQINIPYRLRMLNSNKEVVNEILSFINESGFSKVALITTKTPNYLITNEVEVSLFKHVKELKTFQVIDASVSYVNQLSLTGFDVVIGIGGGKVIDTAKYAAHINNLPCISIPTVISNDGICSPIAVLKGKQNKIQSFGASIPIALLVPLHLIKQADEENIISGIGDLLSNLSAIEDWKLSSGETSETIDDYSVMISRQAALNIYSTAQNYILQGKKKSQFMADNLVTIIESLALSGIAMEIAGTSRPASGAEHLISHSIDELFGSLKPHGIQVAFGMYIATYLRNKLGLIQKNSFEELKAVFRYIGLPTTMALLGITKEQLLKAIIYAPQTRSGKYTVLNKINPDPNYIGAVIDELFGAKVELYIP